MSVIGWSATNSSEPMLCDSCQESKVGILWHYWSGPTTVSEDGWLWRLCEVCADDVWMPGKPLPWAPDPEYAGITDETLVQRWNEGKASVEDELHRRGYIWTRGKDGAPNRLQVEPDWMLEHDTCLDAYD